MLLLRLLHKRHGLWGNFRSVSIRTVQFPNQAAEKRVFAIFYVLFLYIITIHNISEINNYKLERDVFTMEI